MGWELPQGQSFAASTSWKRAGNTVTPSRRATRTLPVGSGLFLVGEEEDSAVVRARVAAARAAAVERWTGCPGVGGARTNAEVPGRVLRSVRRPGGRALRPLNRALAHGVLSPRGVDRCLRLAWTLADLAGAVVPGEEHVAEAMVLRGED